MPPTRRLLGPVLVLAVALTVTACGSDPAGSRTRSAAPRAGAGTATAAPGGPAPATGTAVPVAPYTCTGAARGTVVPVPVPGGTVDAYLLGRGSRLVVLSNQSDEDHCAWAAFATTLARSGYRVALWDYLGGSPAAELSALVSRLRATGVTRTVLIGASKGAKASLVAAAGITPPVSGVVSLSAEAVLAPSTRVVDRVRRLPCPVLLVTSTADPYGSAPAARDFLAAAPTRDKHLVTVAGDGHGTRLLGGPAGATVVPAVLDFLRRTAGAG